MRAGLSLASRVESYEVEAWKYESTILYGGPKVEQHPLHVTSVTLSPDGAAAFLGVAGMHEGTVVHTVAEDDAWIEGQSLISTVEDVELLDPDLSGERLLYRLFHERGVRVFKPLPLRAQCSCSREAVSAMLNSFAPQDRAGMVKDGKVAVTCEFCSSLYQFTPDEAGVE